MDIGKVHLTGLVFVKMIRDPGSGLHEGGVADRGSYFRVVFSNELGMTYFDFEISSRTTRVVFCFEPLNKKGLLKILGGDFRLLLNNYACKKPCRWFIQRETGYLVGKDKPGSDTRWYTLTAKGDTLVSVARSSSFSEMTRILFTRYNLGFPGKINIENPICRLNLSLKLLSVN